MGDNNIDKTISFLKEQYDKSHFFNNNKAKKDYRFEHSIRVMEIGINIARKENLDIEALALGCILHDISYMNGFNSDEEWLNHGRDSAIISRNYLMELGLEENKINEICYGIAIHVDDKANFKGERTALALSIGDCDNIDRFDVYRIYDMLEHSNFSEISLKEKIEYVDNALNNLTEYRKMNLATKTATEMWIDKVSFQLEFYRRLKEQLKYSKYK